MSKIYMHVIVVLAIILNVSCGETSVSPESVKIGEIQKFGEHYLNKNIQHLGYISNIYICNYNDGYTCLDISDGQKSQTILIKTDKVDIKIFNESLENKVELIFTGVVKKMNQAKGLGGDAISRPSLVVNLFKKKEALTANSDVTDAKETNPGINSERWRGDWKRVEGASYSYDLKKIKRTAGIVSFSIGYDLKSPYPISGKELFGNSLIYDFDLQCEKSVLTGIERIYSERNLSGVVLEQTQRNIDFSKQRRQLGLEPFTLEGLGRQVEGAIKDELDQEVKFLQPILAIVVPLCDG